MTHVIKTPGLFTDVWQCTFIGAQYQRAIIYAEEIHNISLLKVIATSVWIGSSLAPEGSLTRTYPIQTELEPLEFDSDGFLDMNRTLVNPLLSLGVTLSPWLSILGLTLGLAGLALSCCCMLRQRRLMARMKAHSASENMSFEPRRGPSDHSRTELTEAVVHETMN